MKAILPLITAILCFCILFYFTHKPDKVSVDPIKKVQKTDSCGWCKAVKAYSLNVNCYHYGEK